LINSKRAMNSGTMLTTSPKETASLSISSFVNYRSSETAKNTSGLDLTERRAPFYWAKRRSGGLFRWCSSRPPGHWHFSTEIRVSATSALPKSAHFHITCPPPRPLFCPASSSVDSARADLQSRP
jgi:hypothetical protein